MQVPKRSPLPWLDENILRTLQNHENILEEISRKHKLFTPTRRKFLRTVLKERGGLRVVSTFRGKERLSLL